MNGRAPGPERPDASSPPPPADPAATDIERADERKPGSVEQAPEPDPAESVTSFLETGLPETREREADERGAGPTGP